MSDTYSAETASVLRLCLNGPDWIRYTDDDELRYLILSCQYEGPLTSPFGSWFEITIEGATRLWMRTEELWVPNVPYSIVPKMHAGQIQLKIQRFKDLASDWMISYPCLLQQKTEGTIWPISHQSEGSSRWLGGAADGQMRRWVYPSPLSPLPKAGMFSWNWAEMTSSWSTNYKLKV